MSTKTLTPIKSAKTVPVSPEEVQGAFRWIIIYKDKTVISKYNADNTKNVYADKGKIIVPVTNATAISLTDKEGNVVTNVAVPDGAVVFQRRRGAWGAAGLRINYYDRWYDATETIAGGYDKSRKAWIPDHTVTRRVPEVTYEEYWIVGWRKREADKSITMQFDAVYPDGKVDHHTAFGEKPWLYEPQWKPEEQV